MLPLNFDLKKYIYNLHEWYTPVFIMQQYTELMNLYPDQENHHLFKKAKEATQGAITILGSRRLHEDNSAVMQMNRQSQRPDVIAAQHIQSDGLPALKISPLEITEMEEHTTHKDIAKFLIEKKLSKNYPNETIFICMVNKVVSYNIRDIAERIKPANKKNPIYIVGKVKDTNPMSFFIATPQPIIAKTGFDLAEQGRNYPYPFRMSFTEDKTSKEMKLTRYAAEPIDLFDFFMLDKVRIEREFSIANA